MFVPFGASVKNTLLSTILNDPVNLRTASLSECVAAVLPNDPLSTPTKLIAPPPDIGPIDVVPTPTDVIFINSVPTSRISPSVNEEIPATLKIVEVDDIFPPTLFETVVLTGVNAIGDWIKPSISITVFSSFLVISNWWILPDPNDTKVTPVPALAFDLLVANLNVSFVILIANTSVGTFVLCAVVIAVAATPTNELLGVYFNFSAVLKKWSVIVKTPVAAFSVDVSVGLNCLEKIGILLDFNSNSFLFALSPLTALYCLTFTDSETLPYVKSGGTLNISISV